LAKERRWRRIVRRWRSSGLNIREFCDWQGLSESLFYAWRRELAKRDREVAAAASLRGPTDAERAKQTGSTCPPAAAFVPVHVVADGAHVEPADSSGVGGLEVHLPGGVRLSVPPECDRALLRDVIACCRGMQPEPRPC
jgi:hypothetical protein